MLGRPHILVFLTTHNDEQFIEQRLRTIFEQRGSFTMVINLFDDCSTDTTLETVKRVIETAPAHITVRIFENKNNQGRQAQYNKWFKLMKEGTGDYACFLDGDDWWESPTFLRDHLRYHALHRKSPASYSMSYLFYQENGGRIVHPQQQELANSGVKELTAQMYAKDNPTPNMNGGLYKLAAVQQIPDELLDFTWADWLFNFMLSWQGSFGFIRKPQVVYRIHPAGQFAGGANNPEERRKKSYENFLRVREFVGSRFGGLYDEGLDNYERAFFPALTNK